MADKRKKMNRIILKSKDGFSYFVRPCVVRRLYGLEECSKLVRGVYFIERINGFALEWVIKLAKHLNKRKEPIGLRRFCKERNDRRFEEILSAVMCLKVAGYAVEEWPDLNDCMKISSAADNETRASSVSVVPVKSADNETRASSVSVVPDKSADNETRASSVSVVPVKSAVQRSNTVYSLNSVEKKIRRTINDRCKWMSFCTFEPADNQFSAIGAGDRVIKVWDQLTDKLKVSLAGHISSVRGGHLFSCGKNKQVKCWDLEYSKVIRHYHGHLSTVFSMALHPTIDVLVTGGCDGTARVWDMRTKANVHILTGHKNTVASVFCQVYHPQVITGSHDSTIKLWDLVAGKSVLTLSNQHKSIGELTLRPTLDAFTLASPDNLNQWRSKNGKFLQTMSGHNAIINWLATNEVVLPSWDWKTRYNFQRLQPLVQQPGSMDSEAGIFSANFDVSGTRMITTEADKIIKIFKEDDTASEESHFQILRRKKY